MQEHKHPDIQADQQTDADQGQQENADHIHRDPADLSAPYSAFTINEDNTVNLTFKEGDMINVLDFAHLDHEAFSPESGVIFMYFNGSGEGAPEQLYTVPLAYVLYIDGDGPHALDAAPHYAPQALIDAFDG